MKFATALLTAIAIGVAANGCLLPGGRSDELAANEDLNLTNEEVKSLAVAADSGDFNAAFRLYLFYAVVSLDHDAAERWLRRAATSGHLTAQYNLGIELMGRGGPSEKAEGRQWLERAREGGYEPARETLERYMTE
jgi:TPR repeat protein